MATWCEELTHLKRPWCWERLRAGGEGDNRGWDGWMASPTRWTWVWVDSGSWWWTGRPGVLQFMGSQRVGHDWATELNWTDQFWRLEAPNQNVSIINFRWEFFLACRMPPSGCILNGEERGFLVSFLIRVLIPSWGPPSWARLNLITFLKSHLQIPSHWRLSFQHMNSGGTQFSS